ncbi:hypothetical protein NYE80_15810 [Paenibacillus sp. FSL H7-0357]|uniref:hypothetical protein n=1 Tax=Paenibacillus sp. FSL H7-0357 TaxID=1536774 RepID=UPI0030D2976C
MLEAKRNSQNIINLYHTDFRLLNGKLLEYYGCTKQLSEALSNSGSISEIEEVKPKEIEDFVPMY